MPFEWNSHGINWDRSDHQWCKEVNGKTCFWRLMERSSQTYEMRINDIWIFISLCTHNDMTTPCPDAQCWRVCAAGGFAEFTLFAYPRVLCRRTMPTLNVRGRGGSSPELLHVGLRECLLRTFFHQQSPWTWSCIALWYERATDMCAHTTQDQG